MRDYSRMVAEPSVSEGEKRWLQVLSTLNEPQARLFVAQRALELGKGGISQVARLTGMSRPAIYRGIAELRGQQEWKPSPDRSRIRRAGGGRKPETVVNLIGSARTRSGLQMKAMLDKHTYKKGQKISSEQVEQLNLKEHSFHPDWNYSLSPQNHIKLDI
jgi:hypothetical protein